MEDPTNYSIKTRRRYRFGIQWRRHDKRVKHPLVLLPSLSFGLRTESFIINTKQRTNLVLLKHITQQNIIRHPCPWVASVVSLIVCSLSLYIYFQRCSCTFWVLYSILSLVYQNLGPCIVKSVKDWNFGVLYLGTLSQVPFNISLGLYQYASQNSLIIHSIGHNIISN